MEETKTQVIVFLSKGENIAKYSAGSNNSFVPFIDLQRGSIRSQLICSNGRISVPTVFTLSL